MTLCLFSCKKDEPETPQTPSGAENEAGGTIAPEGLWANATYLKDTTFGEGAKTVTVKVIADGKSVTFTVKTDAETLGDALLAHNLIAGDEGQYGLYVKVVNGMTADYNTTRTYWSFYQDGEYMMAGVDSTAIAGGERFEIVLAK
jgi:hypothetical protein